MALRGGGLGKKDRDRGGADYPLLRRAGEINFELLNKPIAKSVCISADAAASHTAQR
ncbi:MAG: hypothetical protein LBP89_07095 [Helicobacteraceae bacterium]|nr:hypothetical protein [Helicobacteraceae bacterium]